MDKKKAKNDISPGFKWMSDINEKCLIEMIIMNDQAAIEKVRAYKLNLDSFIATKKAEIDACKDQSEINSITNSFRRPKLDLNTNI